MGGQGNGVGKGYNLAMFTRPFHILDNQNATLSEGGILPVVVQGCSEKPCGTRGGTDFLHPMRQGATRLPLECPCGKAGEPMGMRSRDRNYRADLTHKVALRDIATCSGIPLPMGYYRSAHLGDASIRAIATGRRASPDHMTRRSVHSRSDGRSVRSGWNS